VSAAGAPKLLGTILESGDADQNGNAGRKVRRWRPFRASPNLFDPQDIRESQASGKGLEQCWRASSWNLPSELQQARQLQNQFFHGLRPGESSTEFLGV